MAQLRDYLVSRIERESGKSDAPNVQVLVAKETGGTAAKKLISLRVATAEFVTKFIKEVGNEVVKAVAQETCLRVRSEYGCSRSLDPQACNPVFESGL